jgi:Fe-S-cluster containining protein
MKRNGKPDCRSCGACCVGTDTSDGWADCTDEDVRRMSRRVRATLVPISPGWNYSTSWCATPVVTTKKFGAVCAFLRGTPGKRCSCAIYGTRPNTCRSFEPGARGCWEVRLAQLGLAREDQPAAAK